MYSTYGGYPYPQNQSYGSTQIPVENIDAFFHAVDHDHSGKISADELRAVLVNGHKQHFSENCCRLLISLFDIEKNGTVDINGFRQLYNYVNEWLNIFKSYDKDGSQAIDEQELSQALQKMGYTFSDKFIKYLIDKNDMVEHKRITVDQFIVLCVQIQKFTEVFRSRDKDFTGVITISFEDFLGVALSVS